jgi:YidC/Oxa1 family membrane protein insertase
MAITVYITQHQIMSRGGPVDPSQQKIQRVMLYGSPLLLAVFGLKFPIAVLVYWLTTNTWSMCQQVFILRKMPPVLPGTAAGSANTGRSSAPAKGLRKGSPPPPPQAPPKQRQIREPKPSDGSGGNGIDMSKSESPEPPESTEETPPPESNGKGGGAQDRTNSGAGNSGGRTVSSGGGQARQQPRRNNRPAAKPKGKGPRKGGRR